LAVTAKSVHAGRGPLSRLAGTRARTLAALVYAAAEKSPAARAPSLASAKPQSRTAEKDSEIVARGLLVASRDGAKPLEPLEEDLDEIALAIECSVSSVLLLALRLR
jgi:hypothetical protein